MYHKNLLLNIANLIYIVRNKKVMLDRDLAELYAVDLKTLNLAVGRNINRFPPDFMFQLDTDDLHNLFSQNTLMRGLTPKYYIIRNAPSVFTEAGALALAFVLKSEKAVEIGQFIIRGFSHLRRFVLKDENLLMELKNNDHLSNTLSHLEKKIEHDLLLFYINNSKYERRFQMLEKEILRINQEQVRQ